MSFGVKRKKTSTTNLPAALREELGIGENGHKIVAGEQEGRGGRMRGARGGASMRGRVVGRKEARKAERKDRKASKVKPVQRPPQRETFNHLPSVVRQAQRPAPPTQLVRKPVHPIASDKGKGKEVEPSVSLATREQRKHVGEEEKTPLQRLMARGQSQKSTRSDSNQGQTTKKRRVEAPLSTVEKQEEDEIAWLEAHLGGKVAESSSKKKKKVDRPAVEEEEEGGEDDGIDGGEDGLDDLLEDLDRFYPGMYDESSGEGDSETMSGDEDEDSEDDQEDTMMDDSEEESESEDEMLDEMENISSEFDAESTGKPEEIADRSSEKRTQPANEEPAPGRYIPPALRRKAAEGATSDSEEMQKLRRQAKGLLNRLGEGNIESIVMEIVESLYRQYSRADVTQALTSLIIQTVSSSSNLVETFVVLHAAFVASLHRLVGIEFGAHFLQTIIENWLTFYIEAREKQEKDQEGVEEIGKEGKNLIVLIANLYNLGVVACPLIFDIIKLTLGIEEGKKPRSMTELDVELLLKIVKTSGPQLRHDDPTSLKTIVHLAQDQQSGGAGTGTLQPNQSISSRSKFMLEALEDLKNNRTKAIQGQGLEQQSIARMKKYLNGLSRKRTVRTQEPLRVGLKDLRDVDKRGKWWLVGAAWAGYDFNDKEVTDESATITTILEKQERSEKKIGTRKEEEKKEALISIARQHGMNTSIRQNIFVILISSQDYLDALEKLQSLKFKKDNQRREIIRVLLHCIGSEANYNPYYVILASRLAVDDIGTRFTLQYCLWDFLRELGEKGVGGRSVIERNEEDSENEEGETESFLNDNEEVSTKRIANVARAYGWWLAKGALNLSSLKVIDFTNLKSRGIQFLQQVIIHLLLSIQTSSPALTLALSKHTNGSQQIIGGEENTIDQSSKQSIESVFVKGTLNNTNLSQGLLFFFERNFKPKDCIRLGTVLGAEKQTIEQLIWARAVAKQIVKVGAHSSSRGPKVAEM